MLSWINHTIYFFSTIILFLFFLFLPLFPHQVFQTSLPFRTVRTFREISAQFHSRSRIYVSICEHARLPSLSSIRPSAVPFCVCVRTRPPPRGRHPRGDGRRSAFRTWRSDAECVRRRSQLPLEGGVRPRGVAGRRTRRRVQHHHTARHTHTIEHQNSIFFILSLAFFLNTVIPFGCIFMRFFSYQ